MKKIISLIITIFIALSSITTVKVEPVMAEGGPATTIKVATYNIGAGLKPKTGNMTSKQVLEAMSKKIAEKNIEFVGVQEVDYFNSRNDYDMMAEFVNERYPYVHFAKGRDYEGGAFGTGVISQYPLLQASSTPINSTGSNATKTSQRTVIEKDGKQIAIYNIHFSYETIELRQRQMRQVIDRINADPIEYKVIMGDFNADQNLYEYSVFLDNFYFANGLNGTWFDTFNGVDSTMKVNTIDNIIVSKNIKINNVEMGDNQLSDHNMFIAELELQDQITGTTHSGNLALGQLVEASSSTNNTSALALTDYDKSAGWVSDVSKNPIIKVNFNRAIKPEMIRLHWDTQRASKYEIIGITESGSSVKLVTFEEQKQSLVDDLKLTNVEGFICIQIKLLGSIKDNDVYALNEIEVFGDYLNHSSGADTTNILPNGSFEMFEEAPTTQKGPANTHWDVDIWENNQKASNWVFQMYKNTADKSKFLAESSTDKKEGNTAVKVSKMDTKTDTQAFLKQVSVPIKANTEYEISFWIKSVDLTNSNFVLSFTQKDANGVGLSGVVLEMKDVITSNSEWTFYKKKFSTNAKTISTDIAFKIMKGQGSFMLDAVKLSQVESIPTVETLVLSSEHQKMKVGEKQTITLSYLPADAENHNYKWSSSDESVMKVDQEGVVTAFRPGSSYISVQSTTEDRLISSLRLQAGSDNLITSQLKDAIFVALMKIEAEYTQASWILFESVLIQAQAILLKATTQEEIDSAEQALLNAQLSLVKANQDTSDMYEEMRTYWKQELIGIDADPTDVDYLKISGKLDETTKNLFETMNDLTTPGLKTIWSDDELLANVKGAEVTIMLDRLKIMAIQTKSPLSVYYQDEKATKKIIEAISFISEKRYNATSGSTGNWWDGEIGTPKALVDLAVLFYDDIIAAEPQLIKDIVKGIDAHILYADRRGTSSAGMKETGANLIDKIIIVIKRAMLDGNHERLEHARSCMGPLFELVKSGDGFYEDGSFIFHSNIAYNGSYGYVQLDEVVNSIALLNFTDIPVGKNEINFFESTLSTAYFPILTVGGNIVDSVRGRAISRMVQEGGSMGARLMGVLLQYAQVAETSIKTLINEQVKLILNQKGTADQTYDYSLIAYSDYMRIKQLIADDSIAAKDHVDTYKQFSYMNKAISARKESTFALSMSSQRIYNTETGNDENTKGYYQGQGMTQFYTLDINQYNEDYWATVDNMRLPGVTSGHQTLAYTTTGQNNWAGGSTLDGKLGVSGQIINATKALKEGGQSGVSANKSWFVLDDRIVALGSDINNVNPKVSEVETIIDNRKIQDSSIFSDSTGKSYEEGSSQSDADWFYIENEEARKSMGYISLDDNKIEVKSETREGKWYDINQIGKFTDHSIKSNKFASLAINHGQNPSNATYKYMVLPASSKQTVEDYSKDSQIQIIKAENNVHALKDLKSNQEFYNFFEASTAGNVRVSAPVSLVLKQSNQGIELAVADPTRNLGSVEITIGNINTNRIDVTNGDATIKSKTENEITLIIPFASKNGLSVKVNLGAEFAIKSENYALNKEVTASGVVSNGSTAIRQPEFAVDGNRAGTKFWASEYLEAKSVAEKFNDAWLQVDLGEVKEINQASLYWNTGRAKKYELQVSKTGDEGSFKTIYLFDDNSADKAIKDKTRIDILNFDAVEARYVRMKGIERTSMYWPGDQYLRAGYVLFEIEVANGFSIRTYVSKAQEILEKYPHEVMNHLSEEEYKALATPLQTALSEALEFMKLGNGYDEAELQVIASKLNEKIENYDAQITHVTDVKFDVNTMSVNKSDHFNIKATVEPAEANLKEMQYTSSDENVVSIREDGTFIASGAGEATITATSLDNLKKAQLIIKVQVASQRIELDQDDFILKKGDTKQLNATVYPKDATVNTKVIYSSSNDAVASINQSGLVTSHSKGTAMIKAEIENMTLFKEIKVEVEVDLTAESSNLALNKEINVSSVVNNSNSHLRLGKFANDGDLQSRWASEYLPEEDVEIWNKGWLQVDLTMEQEISKVKIFWEASKAKDYDLLGSKDGIEYFTIYEFRSDDVSTSAREDVLEFEKTKVRYLKMQGLDRSSNHNSSRGGYSIYEIEAYDARDYYASISEGKDLLNKYDLPEKGTYQQLKQQITNIEILTTNESFTSEELYNELVKLDAAIELFKGSIIHVESIQLKVDSKSLLVGEKTSLNVTITPEDADNKNYTLKSSDETVIKIENNALVAVHSGVCKISVKSNEGNFEDEIEMRVRTNTFPVITGSNITVSLFSDFNVLTGIRGSDLEDGELSVSVDSSNLDLLAEGQYEVIYSVVDSDGNMVTFRRLITVVKNSESNQIKETKGMKVEGAINPNTIFTVENQSDNQELINAIQGKFKQGIISVYNLGLTLNSRSSVYEGTLKISMPTLAGYGGIKVFLLEEGVAYELKSWSTNKMIHFETESLGKIILTGTKDIPRDDEGDEGENPVNRPSKHAVDSTETSNNPVEEEEKSPADEPERDCTTSNCGENQAVEPEQKTESNYLLWLGLGTVGIILLGATFALVIKKKK